MASRPKVSRRIHIVNSKGIHARPAALLAKVALRFNADIVVEKGGRRVSARDVLGLLTLEASCGSTLHVTAEGSDAVAALDAIDRLVVDGLNFD